MDALIATVKSSPTTDEHEVLVPGELENRAIDRSAGLVTLAPATIVEINALAARAGVAPLTEE